MRVLVLGSAAGGGFPQWNCDCGNCSGVRRGTLRAIPRTQSSIAVTVNDLDWVLLNASPDIRTQLANNSDLWPQSRVRGTPIRGIILIDAQIDHTTGLLILREGEPLNVYCSNAVYASLNGPHPLFKVLAPFCGARHHAIPLNGDFFEVKGVSGLHFTAIPLAGNPPRYVSNSNAPGPHTIAIAITEAATGKTLLYAPAVGSIDGGLKNWLAKSDVALMDGTFWEDDELVRQGCGTKRAHEMGHLSLAGPQGLIQQLKHFPHPRKVLIHINNTNPILDEESPERAILNTERIEVAYDGMQLVI